MNNADKPKKSAHQIWREGKEAGLDDSEMKALYKSEGIIVSIDAMKRQHQIADNIISRIKK